MLARDVRPGDWIVNDDIVILVLEVHPSADPKYDLYFRVWMLRNERADVRFMVFNDDSDLAGTFRYEVIR